RAGPSSRAAARLATTGTYRRVAATDAATSERSPGRVIQPCGALLHYFRRGTGCCGACEQALELHRGRLDQVPRQCGQYQRRDEADQCQPEDADLVAQQVDRQLLEREGVDVHAVREVAVFAEPGKPGQLRIGQVDEQVGQRYRSDVRREG